MFFDELTSFTIVFLLVAALVVYHKRILQDVREKEAEAVAKQAEEKEEEVVIQIPESLLEAVKPDEEVIEEIEPQPYVPPKQNKFYSKLLDSDGDGLKDDVDDDDDDDGIKDVDDKNPYNKLQNMYA